MKDIQKKKKHKSKVIASIKKDITNLVFVFCSIVKFKYF